MPIGARKESNKKHLHPGVFNFTFYNFLFSFTYKNNNSHFNFGSYHYPLLTHAKTFRYTPVRTLIIKSVEHIQHS